MSGPQTAPGSMNPTQVRWSWAGAHLHVASRDPGLGEWMARYTGLAPAPSEATPTPDFEAEGSDAIRVAGVHRLGVADERSLRTWLALILSDELGKRSGAVILHAAAFLRDGRATLVCGKPWAGKSSTALLALAAGFPVLGDDIVRVLPAGGQVEPCPRPLKTRRVPTGLDLRIPPDLAAGAFEAMHYDEPTCLYPRLAPRLVPIGTTWPVERILHLERAEITGFDCVPLARWEALGALLNQVRCAAPDPLPAMTAAIRPLAGVGNLRVRVGPGALPDAFRSIIAP